jgi:hypothetical protein
MTVPVARLSSFYLFYYAALGAFTRTGACS